MARSSLLARIDPGYLLVLAGLVMLGACVLLPLEQECDALALQKERMEARENEVRTVLYWGHDLIHGVEKNDPDTVLRVTSAVLNRIPSEWTPVLQQDGQPAATIHLLERSARGSIPDELRGARKETALAAIFTGEYRVWLLGVAVLCIFYGLILAPQQGQDTTD